MRLEKVLFLWAFEVLICHFNAQQTSAFSLHFFPKSSNNGLKRTPRFFAAESTPSKTSSSKPIDPSGWPERFPAKEHCSKCGLCETTFVSHVKEACAFLGDGMSRIDDMEVVVHGRGRDMSSIVWTSTTTTTTTGGGLNNDGQPNNNKLLSGVAEEARFGVLHQPVMLGQGVNISGAQWTGCVTGIALSMLESGKVDAVVCIAANNEEESGGGSWSTPEPILARTSEEVLKGRGVKPALAPSLRVLDEIKNDKSIRKLLFCGVGCAVQGEKTNSE